MEGKIYTPDELTYVYANSLKEAKDAFEGEMEYLPEDEDWQELSLNTIAHATEMVGIGGFNEVEFEAIIRWNNIKSPYVFTDIEWELDRLD